MTRETRERLVKEMAGEFLLPADDWDAILTLADRVAAAIQTLDELPLEEVEPPAVFQVLPQ